MITNSINSISSSYLQQMLDEQASGKTGASATGSSNSAAFSQMLGLSGADVAEASTSSNSASGNNANQLMSQLLASFRNNSIETQSHSIDAASISQ